MTKQLNSLLTTISHQLVLDGPEPGIEHLAIDSREVKANSLFFAIKGVSADGHQFIGKAVQAGAVAVMCSELPAQTQAGIAYVLVEEPQVAMANIAAAFYDYPSSKLKLVGITGTNGKTTSVTLLYDFFRGMGIKVGLISTVVYRIGDKKLSSTHTTPDVVRLNALMNTMVNEGCEYCFMEVSSHAIHQGRIIGLDFDAAMFTNLTHDHLDYHGSFAEYLRVKKSFFDGLKKDALAIYNADDRHGSVMVQNTRAKKVSYSLTNMADYRARMIEMGMHGMTLHIDGEEVHIRLVGHFNAYNLMGVYALLREWDFPKEEALTGMSRLKHVSGRFETIITPKGVKVIIDYAHTPDALKQVLDAIIKVNDGKGQVLTVVGAGGDRDREKRPVMGKIAIDRSSRVFFTSDNPRSENPFSILEDMKAHLSQNERGKTITITERAEAIKAALMLAQPADIVLIAGKGHETYQEIKGVRYHFDDREVVEELIKDQLN